MLVAAVIILQTFLLVVMCCMYPADEIAVKTVDGFHQLSVPMVSRRDSCRFTLQPYANTLGDFFKSILEEDKAVQHVRAENEGNLLWCLATAEHFYSVPIMSIIINQVFA